MTELTPIPMAHRDRTDGYGKGWYSVADSHELEAGQLLPVSFFDRELILFRDETGPAKVADAYCPHLGAHLASADGCIEDGAIVCPFHKWRFDTATGKCSEIPYSKSIPPQAKLNFYPAAEQGGMILMWWAGKGHSPGPLPFDVMEKHGDRPWIAYQNYTIETRVPLRDLSENLFDTAHIEQLHKSNDMPAITTIERREHGLEVNYAPMEDTVKIEFMQFNFSGMGLVSHVMLGENFGFFQHNSVTPIDRERSLLRIRMFIQDMGSEELNEMVGKTLADRTIMEIEQDMKVLNFKKHLPQPLICAGDGPIMRWREYAEELLAA